jgi:NADH-quinone oxidoreductase subunit K
LSVPIGWYLALAAVLFLIGAFGVLVKKNILIILMCIELMLNAANLTFAAYSRQLNDIAGESAVFFVLVIAAAEVVIGLAIVVSLFKKKPYSTTDDVMELKG